MKELKTSFQDLLLYLKDTGLFVLKPKYVGLLPKTCCYNKFVFIVIKGKSIFSTSEILKSLQYVINVLIFISEYD